MSLGLALFGAIVGFAALVWGADRFVLGSASGARHIGIPPRIVGLTVMAVGTSAPEMLVSGLAAGAGAGGMALGNALGSNITNLGLVLGATALVTPVVVQRRAFARDFPMLFGAVMIGALLLWDGELSRLDGVLLLVGLLVSLGWMVVEGVKQTRIARQSLVPPEAPNLPMGRSMFLLAAGLVTLLVGARLVVVCATAGAHHLGVSELVIGLTVVALGTSLPELASSVMCAVRGEEEMALGTVLGSNLFNLLAVMCLPGLIAPGPVDAQVMGRDYAVMAFLTVVPFVLALQKRSTGPRRVARWHGFLLLSTYVGYLVWLWRDTVGI